MAQLQALIALVAISSFGLWGLAPPILTPLVLLGPETKRNSRLLLLPAIWLAPLVLAAVFIDQTDSGLKTANWLRYLSIPMLVAYLGVAVWSYVSLPSARGRAVICALGNAPITFGSALVTAMAATGSWL